MGRTPQELVDESSDSGGNVVVGLVDKRSEDYVEEFRSFSGHGQAVGSEGGAAALSADDPTVFVPSSLSAPDSAAAGVTTTAIQVRLDGGQRRVVRLPLTSTVSELAAHVVHNGNGNPVDYNFQLLFGFPPKPLDGNVSVQDAGLKGAQVSMKKVG